MRSNHIPAHVNFLKSVTPLAGCIAVLALGGACHADGIPVQAGQKVAFLGDSITCIGWDSPTGYIRLVVNAFEVNGIKIVPIPAGVSGNRSCDMLNRLDADVIQKKPDWLTISCGVNDVWHNPGGIPLDQYSQLMTQIVDRAQAAGIKVMILTATMIFEDSSDNNNVRAIPYNQFLRDLAKQKHCLLADLNADMRTDIQKDIAAGWKPGHLFTMDGVHPNPRGNVMMAIGVLKAFGFSDGQIAKANDVWLDIPHGWSTNLTYQITVTKELTLRQYLALQAQTPKDNGDVHDLLQSFCNLDFPAILFPGDPEGPENVKKQVLQKIDQDVDRKLHP